jgi:hypothetical protein
MQDHRSGDELPPARANPSPPIGRVHALGESHAVRVDLEPVQVPWLADEVETLAAVVGGAFVVARMAEDRPSEDEDRRRYQLRVLAMIREQLPINAEAVQAIIAGPWQDADDSTLEVARITAPVTVIGPARAMLVLVRGAARNVADALGEALRGPAPTPVSSETGSPDYTTRWPELQGLTPAVAVRLGDLAAAARAFAEIYVAAVRQQGYMFDSEHYPVYPDELW